MRACLVAALFCATACLDDPDVFVETEIESEEFEIIGGLEHSGTPAVVYSQTSTGSCTATLIAPRVLLTAGHCVIDSIQAGNHGGRAQFGPGWGSFTDQRNYSRLAAHRFYQTFQFFDIALIRLSSDAPAEIEPMALQLDPLPSNMLGETVRVVGYGVSDGVMQSGGGVKRSINLEITSFGAHHIGFGEPGRNICQGDSGGPTFRDDFPNGEVAIAVSSYGSDNCRSESKVARTDAYRDWLIEVIDAWDGPCQNDGICNDDPTCRTPDPDCDTCGFDGFCGTQCAKPDLDCPLGGFAGGDCNTDFDCESRRCVESIEDSRVKYCSALCDSTIPGGEQCDAPLSVCSDEAADDFVCRYRDITPRVQGASCIDGSDCRSGACDSDYGICVEECGDGLPECAEEYECVDFGGGTKACTFPSDGGCGCRAGQRSSGGGPLGVVCLFVALWFVRRRRRGGV